MSQDLRDKYDGEVGGGQKIIGVLVNDEDKVDDIAKLEKSLKGIIEIMLVAYASANFAQLPNWFLLKMIPRKRLMEALWWELKQCFHAVGTRERTG